MYYDPYSYDELYYDYSFPRQEGPQLQFFPPFDTPPPFQPPIESPQFISRPPRPRPPFFPPTFPGFPDGSQGIRRCLNRNTMIWLINGRNFWFFPTNITQQTVFGFRWTRNGWVRDSIERRNILRFECQ